MRLLALKHHWKAAEFKFSSLIWKQKKSPASKSSPLGFQVIISSDLYFDWDLVTLGEPVHI
jgi:hypothetical protein